jgi:hypothetical protein
LGIDEIYVLSSGIKNSQFMDLAIEKSGRGSFPILDLGDKLAEPGGSPRRALSQFSNMPDAESFGKTGSSDS